MRTLGDRFLIEPYYEGADTKIGSIIIPDSMADSQPSQGVVIVAPAKYPGLLNRYVIFHRFREKALFKGHLILDEIDLVCQMSEGQIILFQHRDENLILPDWDSKYGQKSEWIYLPPIAQEHNQPILFGTVVDQSIGATEPLFKQKVVIEPNMGSELAIRNTLYYIVETKNILAIIQ